LHNTEHHQEALVFVEFRATVHAAWKVIKTETQRNLVAEIYLSMVAGIKKMLTAVITTALLPPFWINADLWTSKVTKASVTTRRLWSQRHLCGCTCRA
jgi:hypothetical protein